MKFKNNMINLPTILKSVTDSLWKWISNVKTLNYHTIVKNFIVAILIFIVYFFFVTIFITLFSFALGLYNKHEFERKRAKN